MSKTKKRVIGCLLPYTPMSNRTLEVCLTSVSQIGEMLQYVSPYHKTLEVCQAAVSTNLQAIVFVPQQLIPHLTLQGVQPTCL